MMYKIEYSKIAVKDLDRVWTEIFNASNDYNITKKYIDNLIDKIESKADYPKSGSPLYFEDEFTGYYFVVFKSYAAFYRIKEDRILVDRVLFMRSDYMKWLNL